MIEYFEWTTGDWAALVVDGELFHEGHSVPAHVWLDLLTTLGRQVGLYRVRYDEDTDEGPGSYDQIDRTTDLSSYD